MAHEAKYNKQWNDKQWDKLETYLVEFGQLNVDNEYLYNLQLQFLSKYISSDIPSIKNNMAELISNKSVYSRDEFNWESNKMKLMNEVDNIILSFNLSPYQDLTKPPIKNTKTSSTKAASAAPIVAQEPPPRPPPIPLTQEPFKQKIEMPKLSKTQRRMSLDLMQTRPQSTTNPFIIHTRTNSLSKPALTSTSTVNVLTKAEIGKLQDNPPPQKVNDPRKFNLTSIIPKRRVAKEPVSNTTNTEVTLSAVDKRNRRASLVGENLPTYIKDQLSLVGGNKKQLNKKQSRLQNLLSNSESLYVHNKDSSSLKSDTRTGTSDYNTSNHTESDDDKEYVSPNSLTRYYEDNDEDEDEVDFVNVDGSFSDESDEHDEHNEHNGEDDDDDYLFKF